MIGTAILLFRWTYATSWPRKSALHQSLRVLGADIEKFFEDFWATPLVDGEPYVSHLEGRPPERGLSHLAIREALCGQWL